ncbi:DUF3239 domain-containing protein [Nocardia cyriacigeorgica]|uniref:Protein of uncharacterized function (DUF3239) n=1 Tax=Nocardia cyriacigeorgica TaxID=135487 RepID=A0A4U8W7T3_9NOCA|nr:DUF3239 domain-containing protein [Nocardia cyriacigeorgica]MBF6159968.1 DUF3239 domain-containing protein [Nocardia cyriacigeorgica]MBF6199052.1 DUF3239 domain-containing protein [Nocardia cyriacigeorgica]MBF6319453.1 DUF3239 domain-containing protein [Nocardia cyriacigeorgica]MBF6533763.1 DUF3239 domain-containing protein [Nocardia cyriacigeorgica]VFB01150.1 Protein of uncharacterised function (DUF3239) [Nocardia cyriacigeorgica]
MRRFEFVVDRSHAHAVNEVVADLRRLRISAVVAAAVAAAVTAYLVWLNHPWSYLLAVASALGAVTALWVALWAPRRSRIDQLYAEGELVPAVVSHTYPSGMVLLALVNVGRPDSGETRYALVVRKVRALPGHEAKAGERVPSIAVRGDRASRTVGELRQTVDAMPIAWGTRDGSVIERARAAISEVEWRLLSDNLALADKVRRSSAKRLLLDPQQLPGDLGS